MNSVTLPNLKTAAAWTLWAVAAAGVLAAVLYVVLARSAAATPGAPTVTAEAVRVNETHNSFSVGLEWTEIDGAVRYDVERDQGDGYTSLGHIESVLVSELLQAETSRQVNYRVRACADDAGENCGPWSAPAGAKLLPLEAPARVEATIDGDIQTFAVTLSWDNRAGAAIGSKYGVTYQIERNTGAGWVTAVSAVNAKTTASHTETLTLTEPANVQYRVTLCAPDACGPAADSNRVAVTPLLAPATPASFTGHYDGPLRPSTPRPEGTNLSWSAAAVDDRAGRIEIQRRRVGDSWGHLLSITWAAGEDPATSHVDEIVSSGNSIQVQYRIRACNAAGCSDWSNTVQVRVYRTGKIVF